MVLETHPDVDYHAFMSDALPRIPFFRDLEPAQIAALRPLFESFICPAGETVFEQGDAAEFLYLILEGEVAINYKPYDTPPIILTRLRKGDVFGWSAVIGSPKYTSSIITETQLEAIRIHRKHLWNLVDEDPKTGKIIIDRLVRNVSPRWANAYEQIQPLLNSHMDTKQE
jgi:CRP-like cAMP-binding protein